jgi:DsbC/DsbD-like thiol-disulfide interchange protein
MTATCALGALLLVAGLVWRPSAAAAGLLSVEAPDAVTMSGGSAAVFLVDVHIAEDHHVMANPASADYLMPLSLTLEETDGVTTGDVLYPQATAWSVGGTAESLAVYHDHVVLAVPVEIAADARPGPRTLRGELCFQGCHRNACLMPATVEVEVSVVVEP